MTASFFHYGDESMASYRYRAQIPSRELGWRMRDETADVWILSKPDPSTPVWIDRARFHHKHVIVDICDAHLGFPYYQDAIRRADAVTCNSAFMASLIQEDFGVEATVIDDPYELDEQPPHVTGTKLFWFGHKTNLHSLDPWLPLLKGYDLKVMSNADGCIPWSLEGLKQELSEADIVLITDSAPAKSANRTVEAIRAGCFVVAEPHPSLTEMPGIWAGSLLKGIEWVASNQALCQEQLMQSQAYVRERFSPGRVARAWRTLTEALPSTLAAVTSLGTAGSTWTEPLAEAAPTS